MAQLIEIVQYLDRALEIARFSDASLNGLQVEGGARDVAHVACAVDASESAIDGALAAGATLLLVHHGLLWGKCDPLRGPLGRKVAALLKGECSLYAAHLPLDAHPDFGNNVLLARKFGVSVLTPFARVGNAHIGYYGDLAESLPLQTLIDTGRALGSSSGRGAHLPIVFDFGSKMIKRIGFVSGSGSAALEEAAELGLDLLVSGEPKHESYHRAKELGINAIFAGHYRTETLGVQALSARLEKQFNLSSVFIDEDSGI